MAPLNRRRFLVSTGSGVLGLAVMSACSSSDSPAPTPTSPAPTSAAAPSSSGAGGALTWERVDLSFVAAYLLIRGNEVAVVDLGTEGSHEAITTGLTAAGKDWLAVKHVILTHKHGDHVGSLAQVAGRTPGPFYAGEADVAGITSPAPLRAVKDGDEVFGLQIIGTPGHTAGHISVFDPDTGVLVAGDALNNNGGLKGSDPQYTEDGAAAAESVRKLAALPVQVILPGHGAPITEGAPEALARIGR